MGLDRLVFALAASFLIYSMAIVGGLFVLFAWVDVVRGRCAGSDWRIPTALYPFTISVALHPVAYICFISAAQGSARLMDSLMLSALAASFVCLLISLKIVRRNSEVRAGIVAMGSKILFVIAVIGFIGILLGLPGELSHV
jgi:hypothetical protein